MKKRIYLDYAATTPVDPAVFKKMLPFFQKEYGNPSSIHRFGQKAAAAVNEARRITANFLNASPEEIIFTSSATESNNLALKGTAFANKNKGNHIIISSIEHSCVENSSKWLKHQGFEITELKVDKFGFVSPSEVKKAIKKNTILVSVMHANNEIGTIEPIAKIGEICQKAGVYFHTDAAQSFGKIPIDVKKMKIDLLTASSHKIYGPKGAACLFVKKGVKIEPILHGGGQEFGLRPSTLNVPAIVGFGKACEIYKKAAKAEAKKLTRLRDKLIKGILKNIPGSHLNGHPIKRLSNNANFWFEGVEGESIVVQLDLFGIAASSGSACSSAKLESSRTLLSIGLKPEQAHGSLRLSLGRWTTEEEINYALKVLPKTIKKLKEISPF